MSQAGSHLLSSMQHRLGQPFCGRTDYHGK
jgi:hypothetical protein